MLSFIIYTKINPQTGMNSYIRRQIIKMALITSPIISLLVVAPVYIIKENNSFNFFAIWVVVFFVTIASWGVNLLIFALFKKHWTQTWLRVILSSGMMMVIGSIFIYIFHIVKFPDSITEFQMNSIRGIFIFSVNLIVFILIDLIQTKESTIQLNKENAELKFANLEAEYKLLKDQINPHFLFNALTVSKSLIKEYPDEAEHYLLQLSDFLRATMYNNQKSASLEEELLLCRNYIALQKVRFGNSFNYDIHVDESKTDHYLPFFTLVTLVENTIKHNSFTEKKPLHISILTKGDTVVVKNNIQPKFVLATTRTGLVNLNQRSKLLSGNEISIDSNQQEFSVTVKMIQL